MLTSSGGGVVYKIPYRRAREQRYLAYKGGGGGGSMLTVADRGRV